MCKFAMRSSSDLNEDVGRIAIVAAKEEKKTRQVTTIIKSGTVTVERSSEGWDLGMGETP